MKKYHVHYKYKLGREEFSVTNRKNEIIIFPSSGPNDFICTIVEELLLNETDQVRLTIDVALPDYYAREIELYEKFYNLIPRCKKPIEN